jgi:hypothetical protein
MVGSGKTVGVILLAVGVVIFIVAAAFIGSGVAGGNLTTAGAILGVAIFGVIPLLLFGGVGAYLLWKGRTEATAMADVRRKERLLGLIQAQGQAQLGTIMVELKVDRETVKHDIYELVQQGLFTGYINWPALTFYSADASRVASNKCPNCGGVRELVGKGIVKCPYCGVELFIPPGAPQTEATPAPPAAGVGAGESGR